MKIAHHGDVPSLDTHNALNDNSMRVMTNIYDPLVRMDKDFKPVPCIAEDGRSQKMEQNTLFI